MIGAPPDSDGPAGIYVHVPFCAVRCRYCDFPTVVGQDDAVESYLRALESEIDAFQAELPSSVDSVFVGGGTPSRLTPAQLARIIAALRRRFKLAAASEITLECNPESIDPAKLRGFVAAGVNRFSIGVQSLDDDVLRRVGRPHDAATALRALGVARDVGDVQVNADLILGLPGEACADWPRTLSRIADLEPDHVSIYLLETDKDTPLSRAVRTGRETVPADDSLTDAYLAGAAALSRRGYEQYEISNFARAGGVSRHNMKYWTDAWYGGFGLGAHGYARGARRANTRALPQYLQSLAIGVDPLQHHEPWHGRRRLEEALFMGLRLVRGVDLQRLGARYAIDLEHEFAEVWQRAEASGLLQRLGSVVRLTDRGRLCSNVVFAELLEVEPTGGPQRRTVS